MKVKITADSTCDLSQELVERYQIEIIPLYVNLGERSLQDGLDVTPQDIFRFVQSGGGKVSTAAVNVEDYRQVFSRLLEEYDAIVHFTISSSMSSCYQNACVVAQELGRIQVVDSENLSTGIGQLAVEAAILAQQGKSAEEIAAEVNRLKKKLDVSFVLDTLEYLRRGGRCSSVAALGANLLSLKPCIEVKNGAMGVCKKYRGNLDKCLEKYVRERLAEADTLDLRRIFITYSQMPEERAQRVHEVVAECAPFAEIYHTGAGCTVSSHCGPGCLGILFFRK